MKAGLLAALCVLLVLILVAAYTAPVHATPANRIVRIGEQYLGTPYGYGKGELSCSELTRKVYRRATDGRVVMPADYAAQRSYGYEPKHRRRGDLLLFGDHVGIFLGHGMILHSSSYFGEVVESDLRYIDGYKGARRIR